MILDVGDYGMIPWQRILLGWGLASKRTIMAVTNDGDSISSGHLSTNTEINVGVEYRGGGDDEADPACAPESTTD